MPTPVAITIVLLTQLRGLPVSHGCRPENNHAPGPPATSRAPDFLGVGVARSSSLCMLLATARPCWAIQRTILVVEQLLMLVATPARAV